MRVLFSMNLNSYLRKLLRWWKETMLSGDFYYRYADFLDGMRRMNHGEVVEPEPGKVYQSIYGEQEIKPR